MLLTQGGLLLNDPFTFFVLLVALVSSLVIAISVHEFSHAFAANLLGDLTATRLGRLTLNPLRHLDPAGSILLLIAGFGWGRPVPVNPARVRFGRHGLALVSAAGPLSNVGMALGIAVFFQIGVFDEGSATAGALREGDLLAWTSLIAVYSVIINLILAVFNLIPVSPLDGGGLLRGIVPRQWLPAIGRVQTFGPIVIILLIGLSITTELDPLRFLFAPVLQLANMLTGA